MFTFSDMFDSELYVKNKENGELTCLGSIREFHTHCEPGSIVTADMEIALCKPLSTDMIKHVEKEKNNDLNIASLYPTVMSLDITDMTVDFEKLLDERIEKCKKERGDNMELLKMYEEYAKEVIENAINKEIESRLNANPTIRAFKELEEGFKKRCEDLFATQMCSLNLEDIAISEHHSGYMFKYGIASSYKHKIEQEVQDKYSHYMTDLYDKLAEVDAHLKLINASSTENDYANKLCVLYSYGIIDENNHLVKYSIPTDVEVNEDFCQCSVESEYEVEPPKKKRGRKPGTKNKVKE